MRSDTQSIRLPGDRSETFAFLADPANLPRWAVGFCRDIRRDEHDRWIVQTPSGEIPIRYVTDAESGRIDFYMDMAPGVEVAAYSRVLPVPGPEPASEYVFTQFQTIGMPDDAFARQVTALTEELNVLQGIFRARAACPA